MMPFPDNSFPFPLLRIAETDSTNNYLKAYCLKHSVKEFTTVVAGFQTSGRGQRGNSWESERGKNLLFSVVCFPHFLPARHQFSLSQAVSLSIREELSTYADDICIKWPNDIYWKDKKICGILIENDLTGKFISQSVAGIGINVNQKSFSSPAPNPVSLWQITGKEYPLMELLAGILQRMKNYYRMLEAGEYTTISQRYAQVLFRKKGFHLYKDEKGEFLAEIVCIEEDGRLVLQTETREKRSYLFKEVEYIRKR